MSRAGYSDELDDNWSLICWRGAVASAIRGARGQAFLREMLAALDAMKDRRLIANDLIAGGEVCAIGAVGAARGIDMTNLDPEDYGTLAAKFGIAEALTREIFFENDEGGSFKETPEARYLRVRRWVEEQIVREGSKPNGRDTSWWLGSAGPRA